MAKYWSASSSSFWDSAICDVSAMPSDKVAITDSEYSGLMAKQAQGYKIVNNSSTGKPQAIAQGLTDATGTVQALDSEVVHRAKNETITGTKQFASTIFAQHSIDDATAVPGANQYQTALILRDEKGVAFGHLQTASYADTGSVLTKLSIVDGVRSGAVDSSGAPVSHAIGIGMDKDGKHFTQAPTPSEGDDSNQIATTKWVNKAIEDKADDNEVVHLAGAETVTGAKTFSAATTFSSTVNLNGSVIGGASRDIWFAHTAGGNANRSVILGGDAYAAGASAYFNGKNYGTNPGAFNFVAHDGTNNKTLLGKPDGTLTWNGKDVITSAGGTMAGTIRSGADAIVGKTNDSWMSIFSGTSINGGAYLELSGANRDGNEGYFRLVAKSGANTFTSLHGTPNGSLSWNNKEVERVTGGDASYIRLESGLQICWGTGSTGSNNIASYTFSAPFCHHPSITANVDGDTSVLLGCLIRSVSETGFTLLTNDREGNKPNVGHRWIAIGRWK